MNRLAQLIGVMLGKIIDNFLWAFGMTLGVFSALHVVGVL